MIKKTNKIILISCLIGTFIIFLSILIGKYNTNNNFGDKKNMAAAGQYVSRYVPLTGDEIFGGSSTTDLSSALEQFFRWGIAITVILAVLFILLGSIQYMTTDAVFEKKEGLTKIQSAIGGLILALVSWLILNTINPALLKMDVSVNETTNTGNTNSSLQLTPAEVNQLNEVLNSGIQNSANTNSTTNLPGGTSNTPTVISGEIPNLNNSTNNSNQNNFSMDPVPIQNGGTIFDSVPDNTSNDINNAIDNISSLGNLLGI